ncbi:MAG: peptidoglycan-binding protein [Pyrinomonadaceae bacterium]|nr:peptidoglycan-binding protein [Pyrinomonadaceae bacterium]
MRILREGMTGPDIEQWQKFLNREGFLPGKADGAFGNETHQATIRFQRKHILKADGIVGDRTLNTARRLGFETPVDAGSGAQVGTSQVGTSQVGTSLQVVNDNVLRRIMPNLPAAKRAQYLPHLQGAMKEFSVNNALRTAAFLAQLAHESGEFRWMEEIWGPSDAQRRYEPPSSLAQRLGNTQTGDGFRFKGRGPIQITGRDNYKRYGDMLRVDLVNNPQLAATPEVAFRVACLYWQKNGLNELADHQSFKTITKRINGGFNGLTDRLKYYERASEVLGVTKTRTIGSEDNGDDSSLPRFTRGLDSAGEITPSAVERNATESERGLNVSAPRSSEKIAIKKAATKKAATKSATRGKVKSSLKKSATATKKSAKKVTTRKVTKGATKASAKKSITKKTAKSR